MSSHQRVIRSAFMLVLPWAALLLGGGPARAVPDFASQTGQPCVACHIGAYGPQLTPFGRAFKIGGYTQAGGEGAASQIPLSLMVISSFNNTSTAVPSDQIVHHYADNNNFSFDQVSLFVAGRVTDYTGGFVQLTYSPVNNTSHVDNTDLRPFTTTFSIGDHTLRVGTTLNNAPTVQDPYNTTFAWGYPYISSALAPVPLAQPMLVNGFVGNAIGYTVYAWYDNHLYVEGGAYNTLSPWTLARFGTDYSIGSTTSPAPYLRAAYEWDWNNQAAHVGALLMHADVHPFTGTPFLTDGSMGSDHYTDYAFDAGYQYLGDGTHIVTAQGIFTHENQNLRGTAGFFNSNNGSSVGSAYNLNQIRANVSYWYKNTYGVTFGWQKTWGPANPVLFQPAELTGSNDSKPNSNAFILEGDWVPFGKADSWMAPFLNVKLGLQYTLYTQFNGASTDYDGSGRRAGDNSTLLAFAWMAF